MYKFFSRVCVSREWGGAYILGKFEKCLFCITNHVFVVVEHTHSNRTKKDYDTCVNL